MVLVVVRRRALYDVVIVDVFSTAGLVWAEAVAAVASGLGKKVVLVLRGGDLLHKFELSPRRVRRLLARASALVSPSVFLAEGFQSLGFQVTVIPNPIDPTALPFRERPRAAPRAVWMRCFESHAYNPQMAVKVMARVRAVLPDAELTMAGPDRGHLKEVQALAERCGVASATRFPGLLEKSDLLSLASSCDIMLNTNRVDNMPVSVIESQAMGLCVVCTAVGGVPYLVTDGVDGLLVPSDDHEAMAAAFVRLVRDEALAARISRNARVRAESYSWPRVLEMWKKLLSEVAVAPCASTSRAQGS